MARRCSVCTSPDRPAVDQALVNHRPFRDITRHFGLKKDALIRHHDAHLADFLLKAKAAEEAAEADDLLAELRDLRDRTYRLLDRAEKEGDIKAEMAGKLDRKPVVNLLLTPEWLTVRAALLGTLLAYPEARVAVAQSLLALEAGNGHSG